jgi:hypothetical protein
VSVAGRTKRIGGGGKQVDWTVGAVSASTFELPDRVHDRVLILLGEAVVEGQARQAIAGGSNRRHASDAPGAHEKYPGRPCLRVKLQFALCR